ncbi:trypsin-like serine peptidase [Catenuloplanes japonicus]|uniref:trypsin-like serine peptidase n=1 Tax=Catenuloplanes japonicus TaxID=33876 RepID=UPI000527B7A7|nr:trypsin-like peptidase domain-containing protein [Catenuloplanes japonicus]
MTTAIAAPLAGSLAETVTAAPTDWIVVERVWERVSRSHGVHQPPQTSANLHELLTGAFTAAQAGGFLDVFAFALIKEGLAGPELVTRLRAVDADAGGFRLQAFQNGRRQAVNPLQYADGLLRACEYVCRIDVDGTQAGTGVLVRPTVVATMAHVIWPLLTVAADGTLTASDGGLRRLEIRFRDYVDRSAARAGGETATLHPDWLLHGSPPTDAERSALDVRDIAGIASPAGPWDLALLRLATPPKGAQLPELLGSPPSGPFEISLLHHPHGPDPDGEPLLLSGGSLGEQLGAPPVRYLHDVNTLGGSSGAPVFDQRWRIVALHQGGVAGAGNRAVPVRDWTTALDRPLPDDVPYLRTLPRFDGAPVIGRRATQQRLWRALRPDATAPDRLFVLRGAPGTGKRFTKRLVRSFVEAHSDGVVVTLDLANALAYDADGFARWVTGALSAPAATPAAAREPVTTAPRDIREGVLPALTRRVEEIGGDRAVWLVLEGFGGAALDVPPGVKDVVVNLMGRLRDNPSQRLILVGWDEPPPEGFEAAIEELTFPTAWDVAAHFTPPGGQPADALVAAVPSLLALQQAQGLSGYPAALAVLRMLSAGVTA